MPRSSSKVYYFEHTCETKLFELAQRFDTIIKKKNPHEFRRCPYFSWCDVSCPLFSEGEYFLHLVIDNRKVGTSWQSDDLAK